MLYRSGPWLRWVVAACFAAAPLAMAADIFLAPRLTLETGYELNRFATASALTNSEDVAFLRATPALDLHFLCANGSELALGSSGHRTEYFSTSSESRDGAEAHLEWWYTAVPVEGGLRLAGGMARDAALPENDFRWVAAVPSLRYALPAPAWQLTAQARLDFVDYDSRVNAAGDPQRDAAWEFRPGLRWLPSRAFSLWSAFILETCDSNDDTASYAGAGCAWGASYWLTPRDQFAASFQVGTRTFDEAFDDAGTEFDRRDVPMYVAVYYSRRVCPWLELFCSAGWETTGSNLAGQDVDTAALQIGATLAQDFELFSSGLR